MDLNAETVTEVMRKESNRLKTFQMNPPWPKDYVDIKKLAKAGFFYVFRGDHVQCAFCRGLVSRWDRDDDPMTEHSRHFTTCPFVMGGEVGNEPLGEDPFPGPKRPRPYDVCGPFPSFPDDDPRSRECPTSPAEPRHIDANQETPSIQPVIDVNNTSANIDNSQPQQQDEQQQQQHRHHHHHSQQHQLLEQQHHHQPQQHQQRQQQTNRQPSPAPQDQQSSYHNSLIGICKICYTNSIELVFLPCGHSVSCLSCAQSLYTCPYCRETITTRIRQYLV